MVLAASGFLEKKVMILLGLEILGEEKALLFFDASLVTWYSWGPFSLLGWAGRHRQSFWFFWSLPICQFADTTTKVS